MERPEQWLPDILVGFDHESRATMDPCSLGVAAVGAAADIDECFHAYRDEANRSGDAHPFLRRSTSRLMVQNAAARTRPLATNKELLLALFRENEHLIPAEWKEHMLAEVDRRCNGGRASPSSDSSVFLDFDSSSNDHSGQEGAIDEQTTQEPRQKRKRRRFTTTEERLNSRAQQCREASQRYRRKKKCVLEKMKKHMQLLVNESQYVATQRDGAFLLLDVLLEENARLKQEIALYKQPLGTQDLYASNSLSNLTCDAPRSVSTRNSFLTTSRENITVQPSAYGNRPSCPVEEADRLALLQCSDAQQMTSAEDSLGIAAGWLLPGCTFGANGAPCDCGCSPGCIRPESQLPTIAAYPFSSETPSFGGCRTKY